MLHSLLWLSNTSLNECTMILFIHSLPGEHLACDYFLVTGIMNNTLKNIFIDRFLRGYGFVLLGMYLGVLELVDHSITLCLGLEELFSKEVTSYHIPTTTHHRRLMRVLIPSHFSSACYYLSFCLKLSLQGGSRISLWFWSASPWWLIILSIFWYTYSLSVSFL